MLSSWRKASAYWSCPHPQAGREECEGERQAGKHNAALAYLSDAGEDDQAQSGAVEAMLVWERTASVTDAGGEDGSIRRQPGAVYL